MIFSFRSERSRQGHRRHRDRSNRRHKSRGTSGEFVDEEGGLYDNAMTRLMQMFFKCKVFQAASFDCITEDFEPIEIIPTKIQF